MVGMLMSRSSEAGLGTRGKIVRGRQFTVEILWRRRCPGRLSLFGRYFPGLLSWIGYISALGVHWRYVQQPMSGFRRRIGARSRSAAHCGYVRVWLFGWSNRYVSGLLSWIGFLSALAVHWMYVQQPMSGPSQMDNNSFAFGSSLQVCSGSAVWVV